MKLKIPEPAFNSSLTQLIFELEHLRNQTLVGSTPAWLFFDLKDIMHVLESLTSARIEGNHTTILGVVEAVIRDDAKSEDEQIKEIANIHDAIEFIERTGLDKPIDKQFICELHRITVKDLKREGSRRPGGYRDVPVTIGNANHRPPQPADVGAYMNELIEFINSPNLSQQDLLKTAIVHHRMAWIHPFDNGNGRVTRLLTYAILTKQKFIDDKGFRILNPTAVFCMDRGKYYDMLAMADEGGDVNELAWCEYVLSGIKTEIDKIHKLLDASFAKENIIKPALDLAVAKEWLTPLEYKVMITAMNKDILQASDLRRLFPEGSSNSVQISRLIAKMKDQKYLMAHPKHPRKYVLRFSNNYLLRGVMEQLDKHDLLPLRPNA